jgi:hypothetical protein
MSAILLFVAAIVLFACFCLAVRRGSLVRIRQLCEPSESLEARESEPPPSIVRLVADLVLISIACALMLDPVHSFLSIFCLPGISSRGAWLGKVTGRDFGWTLLALVGPAALVVAASEMPNSTLDHLFGPNRFIAALWMFLCVLFICRWRILRRVAQVVADKSVNA